MYFGFIDVIKQINEKNLFQIIFIYLIQVRDQWIWLYTGDNHL